MIRKGWEEAGERIIERREEEEAVAMWVYGRLCAPRSIDSAPIPQQPCDPGVMLLIVTLAGSRASARARQSGGGGGVEGGGMAQGRWQEVESEDGERGGK